MKKKSLPKLKDATHNGSRGVTAEIFLTLLLITVMENINIAMKKSHRHS